MTAPPLADLQRWLMAAITDPAGDWDESQLARLMPSQTQSRVERLAVYRNAYVARLLEVLREFFPCLRFAVGDEVFDRFALGYLQAHPPRSYTLHRLADDFPVFLERSRPAGDDWAEFAVELARLELAIDQVFDGPGPEETNADSSAAVTLVPGFRLLSFTFPVSAYYTAWKSVPHSGQPPAWPQPRPQFVALLRRDYIVRRYELLPLQFQLLERFAAGDSLTTSLAAIAKGADEEALASQVRDWFTFWGRERFFLPLAETDRLQ